MGSGALRNVVQRLSLILVGFCVVGGLGCGQSQPAAERKVVSLSGTPRVDLDRAYSIGDYETAIPLLEEHLKKNEGDGRAWFRLGYALHSEKRYEEAIRAHSRAASIDASQRATALYNWACALALQGKKQEALDRLEIAIGEGFNRVETITEDPDLESIREEPAFIAMVDALRTASQADENGGESDQTDFGFWVGDWELESETGRKVARTSVQLEHNGFALTETWRFEGGRKGTTLTFFDPREQVWKQTRVSNNGRVDYFSGQRVDGVMLLTGESIKPDGTNGLQKITMTPNDSEQTIDHQVEESTDGGETWSVVFTGRWLPRKPRLAM